MSSLEEALKRIHALECFVRLFGYAIASRSESRSHFYSGQRSVSFFPTMLCQWGLLSPLPLLSSRMGASDDIPHWQRLDAMSSSYKCKYAFLYDVWAR